jgi:hypothetical protein
MAQVDFSAPAVLSQGGGLSAIFQSLIQPNLAACNVSGMATFNWLFQFNTSASTLETGGAKPVADASAGYSFDTETISNIMVQPVTFAINYAPSGAFSTTKPLTVNMPIFLDSTGNAASAIVLPLRSVAISSGQLSNNNSCIGSYNAQGLQAANSCMASGTTLTFVDGAQISGAISLEDADKVIVMGSSSLCVILAGSNYANNNTPSTCTRDMNGNITYKGDWCIATDAAASATCYDAVHVTGSFTASGVKING